MTPSLKSIIPKLPAKNLDETRAFYVDRLKFSQVGITYPDYLMLFKDEIEIHFFLHCDLDVLENYGMCYLRVTGIDRLYEELRKEFPDLEPPADKPWGQREMYLLDNNHNSLAFGERL